MDHARCESSVWFSALVGTGMPTQPPGISGHPVPKSLSDLSLSPACVICRLPLVSLVAGDGAHCAREQGPRFVGRPTEYNTPRKGAGSLLVPGKYVGRAYPVRARPTARRQPAGQNRGVSDVKKALALSVSALALSGVAHAADIPAYVALKAGASFESLDNMTNTSPNVSNPAPVATTSQSGTSALVGAAVGLNFKQWGAPVRGEVEYDYRSDLGYNPNPNFNGVAVPTKSSNSIESQTIFFNGYYDISTGTKFTPFVGGGVGVAFNNTNTTGTVISTGQSGSPNNGSRTEFAWNVGAGVNYAIANQWSMDAAYRYVDLGSAYGAISAGGLVQIKGDLTSNELFAGVRYQF